VTSFHFKGSLVAEVASQMCHSSHQILFRCYWSKSTQCIGSHNIVRQDTIVVHLQVHVPAFECLEAVY